MVAHDVAHMSRIMRKPAFCICENKDADQLRGNREADQRLCFAKLINAFVFATRIVQSLYYLHQKFQASSHLLWLYSLVCVGPCQKPRRPIFSQRGSYVIRERRNKEKQLLELSSNEPCCEKTGLRGLRPGPTHTRLYNDTKKLEA